ncbi:ribosome small subunit-dependent GTPase A [Kineococcus sp. SYSU DK004]|uniref:ribosome small subunit-dependent GTPase A n=1 Tax=Kineococcus sp. SYSU DK004 TaxID=3383125 RepID=UPI003D7E6937
MPDLLSDLGRTAAEPDPPDGDLARVVRVHRGACDVATADGAARVATARDADPVTGDWAVVREHRLVRLLPRRTLLARAAVGGASHEQALAANVDTVAVVVAPDSRTTTARVERFVALAWGSGARPLLVLAKADLVADPAARLDGLEAAAPGVDVLAVSAATGQGLEQLRAALAGTVVLLGSSGAGKSTLVNALAGEPVMATDAVRAADGRGRHTTVTRELVPLGGGLVLLDTPGLRGVGVGDLDEGLERTFSDVEDLAVDCRFADCRHDGEPGCAVAAAVDAGVLDGRRLVSLRRLEREREFFASRTDARLRAERARRWKAVARAQRARGARP